MMQDAINLFIEQALLEDIANGDITTLATVTKDQIGEAICYVKEDCIIAGIELAKMICKKVDPVLIVSFNALDGAHSNANTAIGSIQGSIHSILKLERLLLNCMQRMSAIATKTNYFVKLISPYDVKILDTRKTTPNFRLLEKEAVRIGGGLNHRFGLYDMIMLKDNHIDSCGGIEKAIQKANDYIKNHQLNLSIEIETRSIDDVIQVIKTGGVNRIMFDNFSPAEINKALELVDGKFETEASGGIHFDNIELYAATGVDFISVGALIHQAQSIDLSMKCI